MAALMFQGTGSDVGKSLIVAGLCRLLANRGMRVAPFKAQNMSNNAAVTADGGEIGRAQALQARAARLAPSIDMNPVLIKPESETGAQLIVQGKRVGPLQASDFGRDRESLLAAALESYHRLAAAHDLILVEGAGSAAEVNLRKREFANMGFATAAKLPVVIIGDIDRGGVIAALAGTKAVLDPHDGAHVRGFIVNRFRGDARLFADGMEMIETATGWKSVGLVPWFHDAWRLAAEDGLETRAPDKQNPGLHVAVPIYPAISNHDDLDPLRAEPDVRLTLVGPGRPLPGDADLIILPGSKSTRADLAFLREQGWDIDLAAHRRRGGAILGICGGFQMLGQLIDDPEGQEGPLGQAEGLGYLDSRTIFQGQKMLVQSNGRDARFGEKVSGYQIRLGRSEGADHTRPFLNLPDGPDGAISLDGKVMGCYLHGLFNADGFRRALLAFLGAKPGALNFDAQIDHTLDALAEHLAQHLNIEMLLKWSAGRAP